MSGTSASRLRAIDASRIRSQTPAREPFASLLGREHLVVGADPSATYAFSSLPAHGYQLKLEWERLRAKGQ